MNYKDFKIEIDRILSKIDWKEFLLMLLKYQQQNKKNTPFTIKKDWN